MPAGVMEIGVCACCKVCALSEGSPCGVHTRHSGVHTPPCASDLTCTPATETEDDGTLLLLQNDGVCQPSQRGQFHFTSLHLHHILLYTAVNK